MLSSENYIYFFTICGFFIGLTFSVLNYVTPMDILIYTFFITLFFYLFIHIVVINFVDLKVLGQKIFNKKEYEEISDYFIKELDYRESKMDNLLLDIERVNAGVNIKTEDSSTKKNETEYNKAA